MKYCKNHFSTNNFHFWRLKNYHVSWKDRLSNFKFQMMNITHHFSFERWSYFCCIHFPWWHWRETFKHTFLKFSWLLAKWVAHKSNHGTSPRSCDNQMFWNLPTNVNPCQFWKTIGTMQILVLAQNVFDDAEFCKLGFKWVINVSSMMLLGS